MILYVFVICYGALLATILTYNYILFSFKKDVSPLILKKIAVSVLLSNLLTSLVGFLYISNTKGMEVLFEHPPRVNALVEIMSDWYAPLLLAAPALALALLISIGKSKQLNATLSGSTLIASVLILIFSLLL